MARKLSEEQVKSLEARTAELNREVTKHIHDLDRSHNTYTNLKEKALNLSRELPTLFLTKTKYIFLGAAAAGLIAFGTYMYSNRTIIPEVNYAPACENISLGRYEIIDSELSSKEDQITAVINVTAENIASKVRVNYEKDSLIIDTLSNKPEVGEWKQQIYIKADAKGKLLSVNLAGADSIRGFDCEYKASTLSSDLEKGVESANGPLKLDSLYEKSCPDVALVEQNAIDLFEKYTCLLTPKMEELRNSAKESANAGATKMMEGL